MRAKDNTFGGTHAETLAWLWPSSHVTISKHAKSSSISAAYRCVCVCALGVRVCIWHAFVFSLRNAYFLCCAVLCCGCLCVCACACVHFQPCERVSARADCA